MPVYGSTILEVANFFLFTAYLKHQCRNEDGRILFNHHSRKLVL